MRTFVVLGVAAVAFGLTATVAQVQGERIKPMATQGARGGPCGGRADLERNPAMIVANAADIGFSDSASGLWVPGKKAWTPKQCDEIRREVAQAIISLVQ